jgi:transcriptional regulator with XRE-family HTH domain
MLLKAWRGTRGYSQLKLAVLASVSPRHLSFVETGRSKPSREFLLKLADTLQVPLAERNVLLAAGGFGPSYAASAFGSSRLRPFRRAIARLLAQQEPYPAVLLDRAWNVVQTNRAAPRFFSQFIDMSATPRNLLQALLAPEGLQQYIENWPEVAGTLAQRVFREAPGGIPDAAAELLLPQLRRAQGDGPEGAGLSTLPFHPVLFRHGKTRYAFFSMVTTVGAPVDITSEHLRLEAFFPADRRTELYAQRFLA